MAIFVPHGGCPNQCSFCNQHTITGGAKAPTPQDVRAAARVAARSLGDGAGRAEVAFFGGSFTAIDRAYMVALLEAAAECVKAYGFSGIRASTRPDAVGEEVLGLLKRYGVTAIELGAQSMDDRVLALNKRGHTAAETAEAAGRIKSMGFELGLQMMTGLYGDTVETALDTADRLIALRPETARIYPTVVLPGTGIAALYDRGEYAPQGLEDAVELCAQLLPRFEGAGVRVIRVGLHAEPGVEAQAVAGPYHPAFRQLVESRIFLRRLAGELARTGPGAYTVCVKPEYLSDAVGQRKENLEKWGRMGFAVKLKPEDSAPEKGFAVVRGPESHREGRSE